jgi:hypothetical protein
LRNRAFSLVLIRLIWDLMFATGQASIAWGVVQKISSAALIEDARTRPPTLAAFAPTPQIAGLGSVPWNDGQPGKPPEQPSTGRSR